MASKAPTPAQQAAPKDDETPQTVEQAGGNQGGNGDENEGAGANDRAEATIEARILLDHLDFKCNTFALLTEAEAEAGKKAGWCTTHEDEVAYVKDLAA